MKRIPSIIFAVLLFPACPSEKSESPKRQITNEAPATLEVQPAPEVEGENEGAAAPPEEMKPGSGNNGTGQSLEARPKDVVDAKPEKAKDPAARPKDVVDAKPKEPTP